MEKKHKHCNPWFSLWAHPRTTMRCILDEDHHPGMYPIIIIAGIIMGLLAAFQATAAGTSVPFNSMFITLIGYALAGAILNIIAVYIASLLFKWVGYWFGGRGSYFDVRAAVAYTNIPIIWLGILKAFELLIFGSMFPGVMLLPSNNPALTPLAYVFAGINLLITIWIIVILVRTVAEAHKFNSWLSFFAILLSFIIFVIALIIDSAIIGMIAHQAGFITTTT
jgi:hypothetical protein